jgi:hypothetical protein
VSLDIELLFWYNQGAIMEYANTATHSSTAVLVPADKRSEKTATRATVQHVAFVFIVTVHTCPSS